MDANSPQLQNNLSELGRAITAAVSRRDLLSSEVVREWQRRIMHGLEPGKAEPIGAFRGEAGLEGYGVRIGPHFGVGSHQVGAALGEFDRTLAAALAELDQLISRELNEPPAGDELNAVLILCAWAHGEWIRIHPVPNGNGRTARILVNAIAQRYGLPAFMRIRPRPGPAYAAVASEAMTGNWKAAVPLFVQMYLAALSRD